MTRPLRLLAAPACLLLAACHGPQRPAAPTTPPPAPQVARTTLRVAAAADLRLVFPALAEAHAKGQPNIVLESSFGASGTLTAQIRHGAPVDVFLSADQSYPGKLAEDGLTTARPTPYARGALAVWAAKGTVPDLAAKGLAALSDPAVKKIALANPEHAPYGRAAMAALTSLGLRDSLSDKLVLAENVSQAAQWATTGAAQAGLISVSLASAPEMAGKGEYVPVPESAYPPLIQAAVVLKASSQPAAAEAFVKWLAGPDGAAILGKAGFGRP